MELIYFVRRTSQSCQISFEEDLVKLHCNEHCHADTEAVTKSE